MAIGILRDFVENLGLLENSPTSEKGIVYIYIPDSQFPKLDPVILRWIGMGHVDFTLSVIHGELTHDPLAYDESLIMAMDEILVNGMSSDDYQAFHSDTRIIRQYEYVYGLGRRVAKQYLGKLMQNRDWSFTLNHTDHGYLIDIY